MPEAPAPEEDRALALLDQVLASTGRLSVEVSDDLREAFRVYVASNGARSLEDCFGWQPAPGGRSIARRLAEARRCVAFTDAWRALVGVESLSSWRRCEILAASLNEFEESYLSAWRAQGKPPAGASKLRTALFQIFTALEQSPPKTAKGIFELLKRARVLT